MRVEPVRLEGQIVVLEPLRIDHARDLWSQAELELFRFVSTRPDGYGEEAFTRFVRYLLDSPAYCPFVMVLRKTQDPVGMSCYMDIRAQHRGLEIGATWIARPYQGTLVNPEAKYLMLCHAFERLSALRVQLKTDSRNLRSQRAIEKLGAVREGILRKHIVMPDGYVRDTVMYSITDDEWPRVKKGLDARINAATSVCDL